MMPKNTREKVIYRLDKTHDWEKVAGLNMADTNEERFIPLLHNVDAEKMERFVKKMGKEEKQREKQNWTKFPPERQSSSTWWSLSRSMRLGF